jgi:hypothetical protein
MTVNDSNVPGPAPVLVTYDADGGRVELPSTIDGIRAALPEDRRGKFDQEIGTVPVDGLPHVLKRWALETRPDLRAADDAAAERLKSGDFTGFTPAEELP